MTVIAGPRPAHPPLRRIGDIVGSEFVKLTSVRSTLWTLVATIVFNVALAALAAIFLPSRLTNEQESTIDPIRLSLAGLHLSQIAIGVLGVLVITSEYGTGTIRATLAAVPQRRLVLAAKALAFTVTALLVGVIASFAAYFIFQALLPGGNLKSSLGDPGVLRAVTGGGLYVAMVGLLGLGLGSIIRASAGAIAALFGLVFVPPILVDLLPQSWQSTVGPYLPMTAGEQIYILRPQPETLGAWPGFGVFGIYAAVALAIGFVLIKRRDA